VNSLSYLARNTYFLTMYKVSFLQNALTLLLFSLALASCNLFGSNPEQSDVIENGPFYYSLNSIILWAEWLMLTLSVTVTV